MAHFNGERQPAEDARHETGAERFSALHAFALRVLDKLTTDFDVIREERLGPDPRLGDLELVRPTVELIPRSEEAAPLVVAFTSAPGLHVAFGRWYTRAFPMSGDETVEEELDRFLWRVLQLIEGRYRESTSTGHPGFLIQQHEFWSPDGARAGGESKITAGDEQAMAVEAVFHWQPWTRRWKQAAGY